MNKFRSLLNVFANFTAGLGLELKTFRLPGLFQFLDVDLWKRWHVGTLNSLKLCF